MKCQVFSMVNLITKYQLNIKIEDVPRTAFETRYEFLVLAIRFDLISDPTTFMDLMHRIF